MPKLKISNSKNGRVFETLSGVLAHVALSSVSTTSGVNIITVGSTTGIYPGMSIQAKHVPPGSIVNAVISSTQLELFCSAWDASTGVASHSAANAEATDTASGGTGHALSFNPQALVYQTYLEGTWRNSHRMSNNVMLLLSGITPYPNISTGAGVIAVPTAHTTTNGFVSPSEYRFASTDELAATPLKRHDGEPHACLLVVHTGGMLSVIHQPHEKNITYAGE